MNIVESTAETQHSCAEKHVRLQLYHPLKSDVAVYLEIPTDVMTTLCHHPRKYLHYLSWCILGIDGHISDRSSGLALDPCGDVIDRATYYYVHEGLNADRVVDLDVIKTCRGSSSASSEGKYEFMESLKDRDLCCMFTGIASEAVGVHLIPHVRGDEWLQLLLTNRPNGEEEVQKLSSINDVRNGFYGDPSIRRAYEIRHLVILKTPNHVLQMDDVPRLSRIQDSRFKYPSGVRYTAQWLVLSESNSATVSNNYEGMTGVNTSEQDLPSGVILHYLYGAAALKWWGRNRGLLDKFLTPRPEVIPQCVRAAKETIPGAPARQFDELDMVMFFWGNNPAAMERRRRKENRKSESVREWADAVEE